MMLAPVLSSLDEIYYMCVRVGGGHEGGENKTYCQDLRDNLTEKGEKGKFLFFHKIIHNFFLEYKFALIFLLNHWW